MGSAAGAGDFFGGLMATLVAGLVAGLVAILVAGLPATTGLGVEEDEVAIGVKGIGVTINADTSQRTLRIRRY
jgi:hypothetical protein